VRFFLKDFGYKFQIATKEINVFNMILGFGHPGYNLARHER
jgi:hypothetical protein